jgi:integrin beta 3
VTLAAVAVVLLAALPAIFLVRDAAADPVFAGLDSLQLPSWAAHSRQDMSSGNRWCVRSCRLRERTWRSDRPAADTNPVYVTALTDAGWRPWSTSGCPKVPGLTCWQRDEYALDLFTRDLPCDLASLPPTPTGSVDPSASAPVPPAPNGPEPPATCVGSLVSAKVANRIDPNWHP